MLLDEFVDHRLRHRDLWLGLLENVNLLIWLLRVLFGGQVLNLGEIDFGVAWIVFIFGLLVLIKL